MAAIARSSFKLARYRVTAPVFTVQPRRFAHGDYGGDQSGHPKASDQPNPSRKLEHPGPEPPSTQGGSSSSSSSQSASQSQSSSSDKGSPAIHRPPSAKEEDPEVRKHNEEMEQRSERTVNQLSEEDNKVHKQFWKGT